jgi:hypothetical protein
MNGIHGTDRTGIVDDGGDGSGLDPRQAAALIEQTAIHARRQFDTASPVAAVVGAGVFLFGYGAVWWSIRDQHVYTGPAGWSIVVLYGLIVISAMVGALIARRSAAGVGKRARILTVAEGVAVLASGVAAWTVQGALRYLGVSFEIVYGIYGPTVPLIALAAATTGFAASRGKWAELILAIVIMFVAAGSTFFGPKGAWGLTGLGCALALLVYAAVLTAWLRRPAHA